MRKKKAKAKPIDRTLLVRLTRGIGLDETVVTDAQLDEWTAKLKAEPSRYKRGRIVMEQFMPWISEQMAKATKRILRHHGARHPGQN